MIEVFWQLRFGDASKVRDIVEHIKAGDISVNNPEQTGSRDAGRYLLPTDMSEQGCQVPHAGLSGLQPYSTLPLEEETWLSRECGFRSVTHSLEEATHPRAAPSSAGIGANRSCEMIC